MFQRHCIKNRSGCSPYFFIKDSITVNSFFFGRHLAVATLFAAAAAAAAAAARAAVAARARVGGAVPTSTTFTFFSIVLLPITDR